MLCIGRSGCDQGFYKGSDADAWVSSMSIAELVMP